MTAYKNSKKAFVIMFIIAYMMTTVVSAGNGSGSVIPTADQVLRPYYNEEVHMFGSTGEAVSSGQIPISFGEKGDVIITFVDNNTAFYSVSTGSALIVEYLYLKAGKNTGEDSLLVYEPEEGQTYSVVKDISHVAVLVKCKPPKTTKSQAPTTTTTVEETTTTAEETTTSQAPTTTTTVEETTTTAEETTTSQAPTTTTTLEETTTTTAEETTTTQVAGITTTNRRHSGTTTATSNATTIQVEATTLVTTTTELPTITEAPIPLAPPEVFEIEDGILPETGGIPSQALSLFGAAIAGIGIHINKKSK